MRTLNILKWLVISLVVCLACGSALADEMKTRPFPDNEGWHNSIYSTPTWWFSAGFQEGVALYMMDGDLVDNKIMYTPQFALGGRFHLDHRLSFPVELAFTGITIKESELAEGFEKVTIKDSQFRLGAGYNLLCRQRVTLGFDFLVGLATVSEKAETDLVTFENKGSQPLLGARLNFSIYPVDYLEFGFSAGATALLGEHDATYDDDEVEGLKDEEVTIRSLAVPEVMFKAEFHF